MTRHRFDRDEGWAEVEFPCHVCLAPVLIEVRDGERAPWEIRHNPAGGHTIIENWPDLSPTSSPLPPGAP